MRRADTPSLSLASRIRDVANAIRSRSNVAVPKQNIVRLSWAVVSAVNVGTLTIDVTPGGATGGGLWSQVSYEAWYHPTINDSVLVMMDGGDRIVMGTMAGNGGGGLAEGVGYAILGPVPVRALPGKYIPSPGNQKNYVVGAKGDMSSGTANVDVQVDGSSVSGLAGLGLSTSVGSWTCTPFVIPDKKKLRAVVNSISGNGDMSFSVFTVTI